MKYNIELTDTFGGEANYAWVLRATIEAPDAATTRQLVRRAKAALSLQCHHRTSDYGEEIRLDLVGLNQVVFIAPEYA